MRGSRVLVLTGALLLLLSAPAGSASGATQGERFVAKLQDPACTHSGAFYDNGSVDVTATMTEKGKHGTNYMVLRASFQQRTGAAWHDLATYRYPSASFPDTDANHSFSQPFAWAIRSVDLGGVYRWRVRFQWWDRRPGHDLRIVEKVRLTNPCPT